MTTALGLTPAEITEATVLSYEEARALAADPRTDMRWAIAHRRATPPEILYFLCSDDEGSVRLAVAENPSAPAKANLLLAEDAEEAVRIALAAKVGALEAEGTLPVGARARSITDEVLDRLSRDRVVRIRSAIAEGLKELPNAKPEIIRRLAHDVEILVAAPLLEHSPVLTDADLIEIIRTNPIAGALAAIACRAFVGPEVTEALVASRDTRAITHLLYNGKSQLQEHTLDALIDSAGEEPEWQEPLVHRPELAEHSAKRLAEIVSSHLLAHLTERGDLSPDAAAQVRAVVEDRLAREGLEKRSLPMPWAAETKERFRPHIKRAKELLAQGQLTETTLTIALFTDRVDDVVAGLAVLGRLDLATVLDIIASHAPRPLAALAFQAGLSASFALELQVRVGRVVADRALKPLADGAYALSEGDLRWQLDMFREEDEARSA